jgi:hypothetical protein
MGKDLAEKDINTARLDLVTTLSDFQQHELDVAAAHAEWVAAHPSSQPEPSANNSGQVGWFGSVISGLLGGGKGDHAPETNAGGGYGGAGLPPATATTYADPDFGLPPAVHPHVQRPRIDQPHIAAHPLFKRRGPLRWNERGRDRWEGADSITGHRLYVITKADKSRGTAYWAFFHPELAPSIEDRVWGPGERRYFRNGDDKLGDGYFYDLGAAKVACNEHHRIRIPRSDDDGYPEIWIPEVRTSTRR